MKKLIWTCREVSRVCSENWCNAPRIQCKLRQTVQLSTSQDLESRQEGLQTSYKLLCRLVPLLLSLRKNMKLDKGYQRQGQGREGKQYCTISCTLYLLFLCSTFPCLLVSLLSPTRVEKFDCETPAIQLQILFAAIMEGKNIIPYKAANSSPCQCHPNNRKNVKQQIDCGVREQLIP